MLGRRHITERRGSPRGCWQPLWASQAAELEPGLKAAGIVHAQEPEDFTQRQASHQPGPEQGCLHDTEQGGSNTETPTPIWMSWGGVKVPLCVMRNGPFARSAWEMRGPAAWCVGQYQGRASHVPALRGPRYGCCSWGGGIRDPSSSLARYGPGWAALSCSGRCPPGSGPARDCLGRGG